MQGLILRSLGFWLLLGFALRLGFHTFYPGDTAPGVAAFAYGLLNDLIAFLLPVGFVAAFWWFGQIAVRIAFIVAIAVIILVAIAEVFFWFEFESRLDRLVFHYLAYPKEVIVFLEDQFYVSLFVIPFGLVVWGLSRVLGLPRHGVGRGIGAGVWLVAGLCVVGFGAPAGMSLSRHHNAFVGNSYLGVLADARYPVADIAWLKHGEGAAHVPAVSLDLFDTSPLRRKHVILVIEESFAGPVWQDPQLRQKFLPHVTALSNRAVSFDRMYATGSRTTRGMEALLNGFMPLPGISTTERPGFERLPALARAMGDGGFHPVFVYGGWPGFSNFSNYWRANGFNQIWTREDFNEDFATSWGVADQALFRRLIEEMDKLAAEHDQVFAATLTVSHHRPYDFPPGLIDLPSQERSSTYAMSYADASLGWFLAAARDKPWFEDTLFIIAADHGLRSLGDPLIPVNSYRIPFLFYAHGVAPRRIEQVRSNMNLPQTLVELYGLDTGERFAGRSLFCDCESPVPVENGYHIGLLERSHLRVITRDGVCAQWTRSGGDGEAFGDAEMVGTISEGCPTHQAILDEFRPAYRYFYRADP